MTPAQRNAKKAMKLYHSGKASSLKAAWRMVKGGAKSNPRKRKRNSNHSPSSFGWQAKLQTGLTKALRQMKKFTVENGYKLGEKTFSYVNLDALEYAAETEMLTPSVCDIRKKALELVKKGEGFPFNIELEYRAFDPCEGDYDDSYVILRIYLEQDEKGKVKLSPISVEYEGDAILNPRKPQKRKRRKSMSQKLKEYHARKRRRGVHDVVESLPDDIVIPNLIGWVKTLFYQPTSEQLHYDLEDAMTNPSLYPEILFEHKQELIQILRAGDRNDNDEMTKDIGSRHIHIGKVVPKDYRKHTRDIYIRVFIDKLNSLKGRKIERVNSRKRNSAMSRHLLKAKNPRKRRNAGHIDPVAIREILLSTENDGMFYRQVLQPIEKNLGRHLYRGKFNRALAMKSFLQVANLADKFYNSSYSAQKRGTWRSTKGFLLSVPSRKQLAAEYLESRMERIQDYADEMQAGVKYKDLNNNPRRRKNKMAIRRKNFHHNPRRRRNSGHRNYMTKAQWEQSFKENILPSVIRQEMQYGSRYPDRPMRREAWNNAVDADIQDGILSERAYDWSHPSWLESYGFRKALAEKKKKDRYGYSNPRRRRNTQPYGSQSKALPQLEKKASAELRKVLRDRSKRTKKFFMEAGGKKLVFFVDFFIAKELGIPQKSVKSQVVYDLYDDLYDKFGEKLYNAGVQLEEFEADYFEADQSDYFKNPRRKRKNNPKRRRNSAAQKKAQSNASKAMKLYQSGKAKSLKAAWRMVKRG